MRNLYSKEWINERKKELNRIDEILFSNEFLEQDRAKTLIIKQKVENMISMAELHNSSVGEYRSELSEIARLNSVSNHSWIN